MFLLREPSQHVASRFIAASQEAGFSYDPGNGQGGFQIDDTRVSIGSGRPAFVRAVRALRTWRHFEFEWVRVFEGGKGVAVGTTVAVAIRHLGFWSLNGARIVALSGSETDDEFAFRYRTLVTHAECGEEQFRVRWDRQSNRVFYEIHAVSRPRAMLARWGYPVVRFLQARFHRDSVRALTRAVSG